MHDRLVEWYAMIAAGRIWILLEPCRYWILANAVHQNRKPVRVRTYYTTPIRRRYKHGVVIRAVNRSETPMSRRVTTLHDR